MKIGIQEMEKLKSCIWVKYFKKALVVSNLTIEIDKNHIENYDKKL